MASASPVATMQAAKTLRSWLTRRWQSRSRKPSRCTLGVEEFGVATVGIRQAGVVDLDALGQRDAERGGDGVDALLAPDQHGRAVARVAEGDGGADDLLLLALGEDHALGVLARTRFRDRLQRAGRGIEPAGEVAGIAPQVDRCGLRATPLSIAALATAGGHAEISRGSKALGMMYSGPKRSDRPAPAPVTSSGTSSRASFASASAAAIFIASLMVLARTSSAPRKM